MNWLTDKLSELLRNRADRASEGRNTFDEIFQDLGIFKYATLGFTVESKDFLASIKWADIEEINVYKSDLLTTDRIDMEIVYLDRILTINEELPGWYQFVIKLNENFPEIPRDWDTEIVFPAFATNYRTIYSRQSNTGGSQSE